MYRKRIEHTLIQALKSPTKEPQRQNFKFCSRDGPTAGILNFLRGYNFFSQVILFIFVRGRLEQARDKTSSRDDNILSWYGILYGQELFK